MSAVPINCFLISDSEKHQETFCTALKGIREHAKCITALNAEQAFLLLKDELLIPDYMFIDMDMLSMNVCSILKKIKKITRLETVPIYVYSASVDADLIEKVKQMGASGFIMKPSTVSELSETIKFIFHRKK